MKIYQITPRLVFKSDNRVYKFFNSDLECREEVKRLNGSPISEIYDEESQYKVKFVKILDVSDYFYTMEEAKGKCLTILNSVQDFQLAGSWLRCFHVATYNNKDKTAFLFGDFVAYHLYIDHEQKEINAIDPGVGFGKIGEIEIDISRFLVSLLQTKNFKINKLNRVIAAFLNAYGTDKIDNSNLEKFIKYRILRNHKKTIRLNSGIKRYFVAYFFSMLSTIKYYLIKNKLKKTIT